MCALLTPAPRSPAVAASADPAAPLRRHRWAALGTTCEIQFACADEVLARHFESEAVAWVAAFEARYSRFRPDSLVGRINAAAGQAWVEVDEEMDGFLDFCASLHALSRGTLDVTATPVLRLWDYKAPVPRIPD